MAWAALEEASVPGFLAGRAGQRAGAELARHEDTEEDLRRIADEQRTVNAEYDKAAELHLLGIPREIVEKKLAPIHARRLDLERRLQAAHNRSRDAKDPEDAALDAEHFCRLDPPRDGGRRPGPDEAARALPARGPDHALPEARPKDGAALTRDRDRAEGRH